MPDVILPSRLWAHVDRRSPDECWPWTASTRANGYGQTEVVVDGRRRSLAAHRAVYEAAIGSVPDGLDLDHVCHTNDVACPGGDSCGHRRCCNPAHLEPVTRSVNLTRGRSRQRERTHCPQGHPYDEANTRLYRGRRYCRTCQNTKHQKNKENCDA